MARDVNVTELIRFISQQFKFYRKFKKYPGLTGWLFLIPYCVAQQASNYVPLELNLVFLSGSPKFAVIVYHLAIIFIAKTMHQEIIYFSFFDFPYYLVIQSIVHGMWKKHNKQEKIVKLRETSRIMGWLKTHLEKFIKARYFLLFHCI